MSEAPFKGPRDDDTNDDPAPSAGRVDCARCKPGQCSGLTYVTLANGKKRKQACKSCIIGKVACTTELVPRRRAPVAQLDASSSTANGSVSTSTAAGGDTAEQDSLTWRPAFRPRAAISEAFERELAACLRAHHKALEDLLNTSCGIESFLASEILKAAYATGSKAMRVTAKIRAQGWTMEQGMENFAKVTEYWQDCPAPQPKVEPDLGVDQPLPSTSEDLPDADDNDNSQEFWSIEKVLAERTTRNAEGDTQREVKVQWHGYSDATWSRTRPSKTTLQVQSLTGSARWLLCVPSDEATIYDLGRSFQRNLYKLSSTTYDEFF